MERSLKQDTNKTIFGKEGCNAVFYRGQAHFNDSKSHEVRHNIDAPTLAKAKSKMRKYGKDLYRRLLPGGHFANLKLELGQKVAEMNFSHMGEVKAPEQKAKTRSKEKFCSKGSILFQNKSPRNSRTFYFCQFFP